jgi:hypothetical protein
MKAAEKREMTEKPTMGAKFMGGWDVLRAFCAVVLN